MYLNRNKILSYNASLNFIVLKRGYGKSWGFKDLAISDFIKMGVKTIWIRRYKPELRQCLAKFLPDITDKYPEHKLEIKGKKLLVDNKECITFYTLSEAQDLKSGSFKDYKYLVFDEFIIEGKAKHYIGEECDLFAGLLSTVFRDRPIKAFLLGNKVKSVTPYNIYFNLPDFNGIKYLKDRKILVYAEDNDNVVEKNYQKSDLNCVLSGTRYYDYAMSNSTLSESNVFVEKRPKDLKTAFIINIDNVLVGVFLDLAKSRIYFDTHCDTTIKAKYSLNKDNLAESYLLLSKTQPLYKMLRDNYALGRVYFNDVRTKILVQKLLDYII